jgi:phosphatidylserine decarboxylase
MRIHSEGTGVIITSFSVLFIINILLQLFGFQYWLTTLILSLILLFLIVQFFRVPNRQIPLLENSIVSPADGKIVNFDTMIEEEYFKDERIRISIFMSIFNVHLNRVPVDAKVVYQKYHPGRYLVAMNPKSSLLNERNTVVIKDNNGNEILIRQIAGGVARRIRPYLKVGQKVKKGQELGFIRFGSRVDIFLPLNTQMEVKQGDKVLSNQTIIAFL